MLEDPMEAFYFVIIIFVIQQLDGNVIGPKIVGDSLGISSFWVLIAVLVGGGLFGFAGMAFGVPVFAVAYRYINKIMTRRLAQKGKPTTTTDYFNLDAYGIDDDEVLMATKNKKKKESYISYLRNRRKKAEQDKRIADNQDNNEASD